MTGAALAMLKVGDVVEVRYIHFASGIAAWRRAKVERVGRRSLSIVYQHNLMQSDVACQRVRRVMV